MIVNPRDKIEEILDLAVDLARQEHFPWYRRAEGGFALQIEEHTPVEQRAEARRRAPEYVQKAILQKKEDFAGLIIGEARNGENFFEKYRNYRKSS